MQRVRLALVVACGALLGVMGTGRASAADTLPSMRFLTGSLVSPSAAQSAYGTNVTHSSSFTGVSGFEGRPPEIVELARALKNDVDLIYDFVHNEIDVEFAFGVRKGPLGTLIDKSGTPFDQTALFVETVRQAGYTARYEVGQVTLTGQAFQDWTGISDLKTACTMLAAGGIPAAFNGASSSPSDCSVTGSVTSVTLLHSWAEVSIGGVWYAFDPSLKSRPRATQRNLVAESGLVAGAAATQATSGLSSGTDTGATYIKNANSSQLEAYLQARGNQLLTDFESNAPADDLNTILGLPKITQVYAPAGGWRSATPPYTVVSATAITGDVPDQYRTKLRVQVARNSTNIIDRQLYTDEVYGRRLGLRSNFLLGQVDYNNPVIDLVLDDVALQTTTDACAGSPCLLPGIGGAVTLILDHPYVAASGTYADQTITRTIGLTAPVAIITGFGRVSPALGAKWGEERRYDDVLPNVTAGGCCREGYRPSAGDVSRQKTAASWLAQFSRMLEIQAALGGVQGEHQHTLGLAAWRYEIKTIDTDPGPGAVAAYEIADQYLDLNIDTSVSITGGASNQAKVRAVSRAVAAAGATLEGSVLEQTEDLPDTASTASRFAWANAPDDEDPCAAGARRFYDWTGTTQTGRLPLILYEGSTGGCGAAPPVAGGEDVSGWRSRTNNAIQQYYDLGFRVMAPGESFLGPGARRGALSSASGTPTVKYYFRSRQRGGAMVALRTNASGDVLEVAHVLTNVEGISKGGGGKQPDNQAGYDPGKAADALKDRFVDRSVALGVDLKTGTAGYTSPTLLSVGSGDVPYGLDYSLSYKGGADGCNPFGPCVAEQSGWTNNWDIRFNVSGSGLEAMGATSPRAAAGTLAAFLVLQDIYAQSGLAELNKEVFAALAADWWRRQMAFNTATLAKGWSARQYVRLVDGSWLAPVGSPGVLTQTGQRIKVRDMCATLSNDAQATTALSTSRRWDQSGVTFSLREADGEVENFAPWLWNYSIVGSSCTNLQGFKITNHTWPQGPSLTFTTTDWGIVTGVSSSLGRSLTVGDTAADATRTAGLLNGGVQDAAGNVWTFDIASYARSATQRPAYSLLQRVHEPVAPTQSTLEYTYDGVGRVKEARDGIALQTGSTRQPYQFFIAFGGRGERVDPLGGRYRVDYDPDGHAVRYIDEVDRLYTAAYDGKGRVVSRTYPELNIDQFTYDDNDNVVQLTRKAKPGSGLADITIQAGWNPTWNKLAWIKDALLRQTYFNYYASGDGASLLSEVRQPIVGAVRPIYTFAYNAIGLPTQETDPTGRITTYTYDAYGNRTSTTVGVAAVGGPALNLVTTFGYNSIGDQTSVDGPRTDVADISYTVFDADRRPVIEIQPDPDGTGPLPRTAVRTTYDANGRVSATEKGTATDTAGATFAPLEKTAIAYDAASNKTKDIVYDGATTTILTLTQYSYDDVNRLQCTAVRMNPAKFAAPPASACAQSVTGTHGKDRITYITYDPAGQKLVETRGYATTSAMDYATWTYTPNGQIETVKDAGGSKSTYEYDGFDRLVKLRFPDTDPALSTSSTTDYEAYGYDANGNRTSVQKRDGQTIFYTYDVLNRETRKNLPNTATADVYTVWDLAGRKLSARFASTTGEGVIYDYDAAGRLLSETSFGQAMTFAYDAASNRTRVTWPDGFYAGYVYDAAGRLTAVNENGAVSGQGLLATFGYDSLGRRVSVTRGNATSSVLAYDNADRLTSLTQNLAGTAQDLSLSWQYRPSSQVWTRAADNTAYGWTNHPAVTENATYDGLNRDAAIAAVGAQPCSAAGSGYDCRGNLTNDGVRTFAYDVENRLTSASGGTALALTYDPLGRLKQTTAGAAVTQFLYDGDRLSAEYDGSGVVLRRYVHGTGVDEPLVWYEGSGVTDRRWLHADNQGSVLGWSNGSGAAGEIYAYGPYGEPQSWSGSRFRYTGQITLPEAALYHYKARVYDPARGRFLQTDPVGYEDDLDLYAYVGGDPVNRADPTGQWLWPWQKPIDVRGGTDAQRKAVQSAVDKGAKTPRGKQLIKKIVGGILPGKPVTVHVTNNGTARAETPGQNVEIDPNFHPKINTTAGVQPASTGRIVWHEIGHAVTGTDDSGPGRMDNIRENENPIASSMGEPERTTYGSH